MGVDILSFHPTNQERKAIGLCVQVGMTLKSNESDTITHYLIEKEGFAVTIEDGRLWVFADGSESHNSFLEHGEPAKCVVFPAAGPIGMTVKGADADVINAYLRSK